MALAPAAPLSPPGPSGLSGPALAALLLAIPWLPTPAALADSQNTCPGVSKPLVALADLRAGRVDEGVSLVVEGVTSGVFMQPDALRGFYLQQGQGADTNGMFVYAPDQDPPPAGHRMQVHGQFNRHRGRPQVARVDRVHDCGPAGLPAPRPLELPADAGRLGDHVGVRVRFEQRLTVSGNHELGRYGSLVLSAEGRLRQPGQIGLAKPGHAERRIVLDDSSYRADPDPIPYRDARGTRRAGSQVDGLTGILTHAFDHYRLHPTEPPRWQVGTRPAPPPEPAAEALRVAIANLENDFVTLGLRGAQEQAERARQVRKLDALMQGLNADLLAVVELENRPKARRALRERLNRAAQPRGPYAAIAHPDPGEDAIQVGMLYRPQRLRLEIAVADSDPVHQRPPLLAWFREPESGRRFGAVAAHFKSKGGCPARGDIDRGQGCWNRRRTEQAERLLAWIRAQRPGPFADAPVLILGDLNAYAAEDPIRVLAAAGQVDRVHDQPARAYTFVFHARAGQLDYILGPQSLGPAILRGGSWAVNADEPGFLAYDGRDPANGPWRSSDHDPVWADLDLDRTIP